MSFRSKMLRLVLLLAAVSLLVPASGLRGQDSQAHLASAPAERPAREGAPALVALPAGLAVEGVTLRDALLRLERTSGVPLAYSPAHLPMERKVSCACADLTVGEGIEVLLGEVPFELVEVAGQLVIRGLGTAGSALRVTALGRGRAPAPAPSAPVEWRIQRMDPPPPPELQGSVAGSVVSARAGLPIAGAQVMVSGTDIGTLSGANGRYLLENVPVGEQEIRVERIGYRPATEAVAVQSGETHAIDFRLEEQALALEELVVTGQAGATRRREIGTSMGAIRSEDLQARPIQTLDDALGGAMGVEVLPTAGESGAGGAVRLRGVNSITQDNAPLIYVDGVRIYDGTFPMAKSGVMAGLTTQTNPGAAATGLNSINPQDIERIEFIRGSAATTLYGTEASGGVIQVFTRSGSVVEGSSWSMNIDQGFLSMPCMWGAESHMPGGRPSELWFETYGETSDCLWLAQHARTGHMQRYNLSTRGQRGDVGYYVSGRWEGEQGVIPTQGFDGWSARANTSFEGFEDLRIQLNNSLSRREVNWVPNDSEAEGFLVQVWRGPFDNVEDDDLRALEFDMIDTQTQFTTGLDVNYQPISALDFQANVGVDVAHAEFQYEAPFGSWFTPAGQRSNRQYRNETRTLDLRGSYRANLRGVATTTSLGFQAFDNEITEIQGISNDFAGPHRATLTSGAVRNVVENKLREVNAGFFFQEMLGFADKLFLTAGVRVDGNSSFGRDFGLQTYPKVSASYVVSDEGFWPSLFDETKLRAAYGEAGRAPGYFDAERVWGPITAREGDPGVRPANLGSPDLGPERTREVEAGFETSLMDGRLSWELNYFNQRTVDALIPVQLDPSLGFSGSQLLNIGVLDNWGVETQLDAQALRTENLDWRLTFSVQRNKSEVVDLGGSPPISLSSRGRIWIREGHPVGAWHGERVLNPNEFADPVLAEDPDPAFGTEVYIGPVNPTLIWNLGTTVNIGQSLQIVTRGEYRGGHYLFSRTAEANTQRGVWPACFDAQQAMEAGDFDEVTALDRHRCVRTVGKGPLTSDASFFRWRELAVNYTVPERWRPGNMSSLTLSVRATNLHLRTDLWGMDPESSSTENEAGARGLNRQESYHLPQPRRLIFSVQTTF